MTKTEATLFLTRSEVASLLGLAECIDAVEEAFRLHAEGLSLPPGVLETLTGDGGFHIKAAGLKFDGGSYYAAKVNGNFPLNPERFGLPTIQGIVVLCDAERGRPLAVMDSMELTALRTGAATGVAAKYLARADSKVVTVCGCGIQGRVQLRTVAEVLRIEKYFSGKRLSEITTMLVEKYINDRLATTTVRKTTLPGGERVNKRRSPTTVRKEVVLLSSIFNMAKQERLVTENPCDFIRKSVRKKIPARVKRNRYLTLEEESFALRGFDRQAPAHRPGGQAGAAHRHEARRNPLAAVGARQPDGEGANLHYQG